MCLCDRSKGGVLSRSRICKNDIEFSFCLRYRSIKIVQVIQVADVAPDSFDARPDLLCRIGMELVGRLRLTNCVILLVEAGEAFVPATSVP